MPGRRPRLVQARKSAGSTQEELAHRLGVDRTTVGRWESGETEPQPWARRKLTALLGLSPSRLDAVLDGEPSGLAPLDDEIEALEMARRAEASDVGEGTLVRLERAVDDLAGSYATAQPAELLHRTRLHLRYVAQLMGARTTLAEHRRLLVVGAWLSLLAATLHVDLEQQAPALARLAVAGSLARECEHDELRAWCLETEAWRVLTLGEYGRAAELSRGAQRLAPAGTSALIQATAQEGRARARLGDARGTQQAVGRVQRLVSPLQAPDRPEHHYRYDPAKAISYTATTLSWVGDPAAVDVAREVITRLSAPDDHGGRPRRLAVARLDLGLALIRQDDIDEAVHLAVAAVASGRVTPSNTWRAVEVFHAAEAAGTRAATPLRDLLATYRCWSERLHREL
ncbi:helix-turn-helix domain-containing protein [Pseudonocardia kunmingensis]|uniref:Helix-turn-helix protein n=1 Tax=Pseudonocardia kunmingensis TaxID=630975 RepID=A0A543E2C7_9PSEU|nr:helix-turn-helix transcriptional regulator [Pseudonocardia kunmingensis]TQM15609.1 helix-turn-helix protein [Pseudonocardia kunmingensis]